MALMYLATRTRPDILQAVTYLATHCSAPTQQNQLQATRVLQYLHYTKTQKLAITPTSTHIYTWVDASHGSHTSAHSQTGIIITLGDTPQAVILAKSNKQKNITRSSTESEIVAIEEAAHITLGLKNFLNHIGYPQPANILYNDNKSAIFTAHQPTGMRGKLGHIHHKERLMYEHISTHKLSLTYKPTENLTADMLTKALDGPTFRKHRNAIMNERAQQR
jgi:hypothetical protein